MTPRTFKAAGAAANAPAPEIMLNGPQYIKVFGDFGGGTITVNEIIDNNGTLEPSLDSTSPIIFTAPSANRYFFGAGTRIVLVMAGSTDPDVTVQFTPLDQ